MQLLSEMMVAIHSFHQLCVGVERPRFYSCEYKQILLLLWWFFCCPACSIPQHFFSCFHFLASMITFINNPKSEKRKL